MNCGMNKQTMIHVASEMVVLLSVVTYFHNKTNRLNKHINLLARRLEDQSLVLEKHEQLLNKLLSTSSRPRVQSNNHFNVKHSRPRNIPFQQPKQHLNKSVNKSNISRSLSPEQLQKLNKIKQMKNLIGQLDPGMQNMINSKIKNTINTKFNELKSKGGKKADLSKLESFKNNIIDLTTKNEEIEEVTEEKKEKKEKPVEKKKEEEISDSEIEKELSELNKP